MPCAVPSLQTRDLDIFVCTATLSCKAGMRTQVTEAQLQASVSEQRHAERAAAEAAKHAAEVAFLENQGAGPPRVCQATYVYTLAGIWGMWRLLC